MMRKKLMFRIGLEKLGSVTKKGLNKEFTQLAKKFDTKGNPSTDDIYSALDNLLNPPGKRDFSQYVAQLYPVRYPNGHVIISERKKGEINKYVQYDYEYVDGKAKLTSKGTELEDSYDIKKFKRKEEDNGNLFLSIDLFNSHSYLLPETFQFEEITIEKGRELKLVSGIVLEPETTDGQGDIYSSDEIRKTAHEFMANYSGQGNGLMHKSFGEDSLRIVESYLAPVDFTINKQSVKKGTWVMTSLILDDKLWSLVKKGKLTGYSIRGVSAIREP